MSDREIMECGHPKSDFVGGQLCPTCLNNGVNSYSTLTHCSACGTRAYCKSCKLVREATVVALEAAARESERCHDVWKTWDTHVGETLAQGA